MMNNDTNDAKKQVAQQIIDNFKTIHSSGNVSMEMFLRSFMKLPTNKLTNEIDLSQAIMGEFVAAAYHVCGVCTHLPEKAYFMPTSFVYIQHHHRRQAQNVERHVLEYKMYDPATFTDLLLNSKYRFADDIPLDVDTDVSKIEE